VRNTVNPIAQTEDILWNDIRDAFIAAYADTAKAQTTFTKLQHLKMHKGNLDTYIATFKHLARDAGYDTNTASTINMFAQNLKTRLLSAIMHREQLSITFTEWIAAAQREKENYEMQQAVMHPQKHQFKWAL